jgi:hypothetical protein
MNIIFHLLNDTLYLVCMTVGMWHISLWLFNRLCYMFTWIFFNTIGKKYKTLTNHC